MVLSPYFLKSISHLSSDKRGSSSLEGYWKTIYLSLLLETFSMVSITLLISLSAILNGGPAKITSSSSKFSLRIFPSTLGASPHITLTLSPMFSFVAFSLANLQAVLEMSISIERLAPLLIASIPTAPLPAYRSMKVAPATFNIWKRDFLRLAGRGLEAEGTFISLPLRIPVAILRLRICPSVLRWFL